MTNNDTFSHTQPGFNSFTDASGPSDPQAPTTIDEGPSEQSPDRVQAEQERALPQAEARRHRSLDTNELLHLIFLRSAWGPEKHAREIEEYLDEARWRDPSEPNALQLAIQAQREGISAHKLVTEMNGRLRGGATPAQLLAWATGEGGTPRIRKHLKSKIKKQVSWWRKKQEHASALGERSTLRAVTLRDGVHPCSLPHQQPATEWKILIDESGERFEPRPEADEDGGDGQRGTMGRLVAVVLPSNACSILRGIHPFHATEADPKQVDTVMQELLDSGAGVFGLTVDDPATHASGWFGHIHELVRWVMLQIPIDPEQKTTIDFMIERRGGTDQNTRLDVLAQTLESEFAWAYNASGGNLLLVVLLHGALNGWYSAVVQGLAPDVLGAGFEVVTAMAATVIAGVLLWRSGPELGRRPLPATPR